VKVLRTSAGNKECDTSAAKLANVLEN